MSRFPSLPRLVGETDDDISIHLYDNVGPAKPLPPKISPPHNEVVNIFRNHQPSDSRNYEKAYQVYEKTGQIVLEPNDLYSDNDLTEVESDSDPSEPIDPSSLPPPSPAPRRRSAQKHLKLALPDFNSTWRRSLFTIGSGFALLLIPILILITFSPSTSLPGFPVDASQKVEHLSQLVNRIQSSNNKLRDDQKKLQSLHDTIVKNINSITSSLHSKFEAISSRFIDFEASQPPNIDVINDLKHELSTLKTQIVTFLTHSDPDQLEAKLNSFDSKLRDIAAVSSDLQGIKKDILQQLLAELPEKIPVSIEDGIVKFQPEFRSYLYTFIEDFHQGHQDTRSKGLSDEIAHQLKKLQSLSDKSITKEEMESLVTAKLESSEQKMWHKVVNLIDELTLLSQDSVINGTQELLLLFKKRANGILLDNFLQEFSDATLKINYADYSLGSRILGFLTHSGPPGVIKERSLLGKMMFGWYDYLRSSIPNPNQWKFNANNLLIDGSSDNNWSCNGNECSVGIRLFNKIIPTDVVIESELDQTHSPPSKITIYIKPKTSKDKVRLAEKLSELKFGSHRDGDRDKEGDSKDSPLEVYCKNYLTKYLKIKQFTTDDYKQTMTIPLPLTLVNLRIPIHDIYILFHSEPETKCGISSVKVYGISELNYHKFDGRVSRVVSNLEARGNYNNNNNNNNNIDNPHQFALGDDEVIF